MYVKTIEVPDTIVSVATDENYKYYWIRNLGEKFVGVFKNSSGTGVQGPYAMVGPRESVKVIPEETSLYFESLDEDTTNKIEIYGTNTADCPFKNVKAKGSEDGGGDNTHYKGTTATPLENGSTTNPITIVKDDESYTYTAVFGDVVVYGYTEFVFDGTQWSEFGRPFDTAPTRNSSNAVTSDGIYRNTAGQKYFVGNEARGVTFGSIYTKASGIGSLAEGFNTTASGSYSHSEGSGSVASNTYSHAEGQQTVASGASSHAEGHQTTASGSYSHVGGDHTIANKEASTAIGKYNVADTNVAHLLIVGNGTSSDARSNILEVSETDMNVNGDIKVNNVAIPTPYTTMPTITADMLGQIAMYVGATGGGFNQGCFYVASTDGAAEPTYSWVKIGSGRTETVLWENTGTTNPDTIALSENITNFDEIKVIVHQNEVWDNLLETSFTVNEIVSHSIVLYSLYPNYGTYSITNNTTLTKAWEEGSQGFYVYKIIGIKYGSGGGSGQYSGTYTPEGAVAVTPTTGTVTGVSANGTLPAVTYDTANEELTFTAGTLPTLDTDKSFVTGATAEFTGTQAIITVQ